MASFITIPLKCETTDLRLIQHKYIQSTKTHVLKLEKLDGTVVEKSIVAPTISETALTAAFAV